MTDIILPSDENTSGDNLWSDVFGNDQAIKAVVNGDLTDGNIAAGAEINGAKLLNNSVAVAKLAGKLKSGNVDLATYAANGSNLSGSISAQTLVSVSDVAPGVYLATVNLGNVDVATSLALTALAGSISPFVAAPSGHVGSFSGIVVVNSLATVAARGVVAGSTINVSMTLFGVKA